MDLIQAIVLGVVQGLTEFLPISSSGHQRIVAAIFGWDDPGSAFTAINQLGTELAVLIYFRHKLWRVVVAWLRSLRDPVLRRADPDARLGWYIVVATIPIGIIGLALNHQIETGARNLWLIGTMLIVFGVVLLAADRAARHLRDIEDLDQRSGFLIGLAQCLALIPGVSRSGATMSAGLFLGMKRPAAAEFSFFLAVPAVLLSGFYELVKVVRGDETGPQAGAGAIIVATILAFVIGYAAIAWLLRYLATHTVESFVAYRIVLGAAVLVLLALGAIS
jgi:undecaprenyl-diphosphatase